RLDRTVKTNSFWGSIRRPWTHDSGPVPRDRRGAGRRTHAPGRRLIRTAPRTRAAIAAVRTPSEDRARRSPRARRRGTIAARGCDSTHLASPTHRGSRSPRRRERNGSRSSPPARLVANRTPDKEEALRGRTASRRRPDRAHARGPGPRVPRAW